MSEMTASISIPIFCWLILEVTKRFIPDWIKLPIASAIIGLVSGVVINIACPAWFVADNVIAAAAIGAMLGLGGTGIDQVRKQTDKTDK